MATNITGVTGNAAGANAANRTERAAGLATQIGEMEPQQARNILSTLNGKIGNRWGYLRLDGSGKGQEVGFTTRWNTNPFRSARGQVTGAALRALFEKAGYDTAALDTYLRDRGNARIELAQVRGFLANQGPVAPAIENQPVDLNALADRLNQQCAGTLGRIVDLSVAELREASDAIRHQPESERHRYYTGETLSLQRADQVLYLLQDSELANWDDAHFEIFKTLETMVDSSRTNNDFQGVVQRFDQFKNDSGKNLQAHHLKTDIRATAELFSAAEPADLETAERFLGLLHQSTQGDLKPYLRPAPLVSHAGVAMRAIDTILAQPGSDEIRGIATNLKNIIINDLADTVLENAQARFADGLPDIRMAEVEWMRMALENLRFPSDHDGIEVPFSNYAEGVNLLLYAATELEKQQPLAPEFTASLNSIRQSYEKEPDVNAAIAACKKIFYLDAYDGYVFPLGNGQVLACDADGFAAWVTGKNPDKQYITVYDLVNGEASVTQNRLELNRMLGLTEVPLFAKGLATLDSSVARNVVDRLLVPQSNQATRARFHLALNGQKEALSVSQLNEEISPIFTRIWGEQVVAADTTQWDEVRLDPQHFVDLRGLMPEELGQDDGGYAKFLINLSSIFTKLGSASVWGDETTSVADLRLYGYLLFREAQQKSPNLLPENNWRVLIQNYKDPTFCAQTLSLRQMDQAKTADDLAYRLVVPPALR
jgi:hypothetical protein